MGKIRRAPGVMGARRMVASRSVLAARSSAVAARNEIGLSPPPRPQFPRLVSTPTRRDLFAELGLKPLINVSGTETAYGAAPVCAEVLDAVASLAPHSVDMRELQAAASRAIAATFGCEAGLVAHCTAAGISQAVAACMTGESLDRIQQLPDTTGLRNEVVLQRGHSIDYGAPLRQNILLTGARIVEAGTDARCTEQELDAALGGRTAAAVFVVSHHAATEGMVGLARFVERCRARGVPVLVDAAAEPEPQRLLAAGADLVLSSGHKRFAALTSAIVAGDAALVRACLAQEKGIGRPMKAGKEAVIGVIAALARWQRQDRTRDAAGLAARLDRALARLNTVPGIVATVVPDATSGLFARVHLELRPEAGLEPRDLAARLRASTPSILVREGADDRLQLDLRLVDEETADHVVEAIASELHRAGVSRARE